MKYCFLLLFTLSILSSCASGGANKKAAEAISAIDYNYLLSTYAENPDAALEKDLATSELFKKKTSINYKGEPANYVFTAFEVNKADAGASAILIRMDIDRMFSTLSGPAKRQKQIKFFCIPSSASSGSLQDKLNDEIRQLDYIDNEVFLGNITQLLSQLYL